MGRTKKYYHAHTSIRYRILNNELSFAVFFEEKMGAFKLFFNASEYGRMENDEEKTF